MIAYLASHAPDGAFECSTPKGRIRSRDHIASPWADPTPWLPLGDFAPIVAAWGTVPTVRGPQPEGIARVVVTNRWTLLSLWDHSSDRRHGAHTAICFDAEIAPHAALTLARITFPDCLARIDAHLRTLGLTLDVQAVP